MSIWIHSNSGTARGYSLTHSGGSRDYYYWDGYSFFPTYGYQGFAQDNWDFDSPRLEGAKTSWNMTNYYCGHECQWILLLLEYDTSQNGYYYVKWYDPDGNLLVSYTFSINRTVATGYSHQTYAWVGMGMAIDNGDSRFDEIYMNGTYQVRVTGLVTATYNVGATNINTSRLDYYNTSDKGYIWVDGADLWMISGDKYKIKIRNDGGSYGSAGTENAGALWIPAISTTKPYLCYVDENGTIRHTHVGDIYGTSGGWSTMDSTVNVGAANDGYIWMRNNWSFIMAVVSGGLKCRFGAGYLYGNGP